MWIAKTLHRLHAKYQKRKEFQGEWGDRIEVLLCSDISNISLYIYSLFKDTASSSDYIASI
jgi:hypothetical protein